MGLILAKLYNENFDKDTIKPTDDSRINVLYNGTEYILENSLDLPSKPPLSLRYVKDNLPRIVLTYDAEDKVVFSVMGNSLHFIIIIGDESRGSEDSTSYPWLTKLNGIKVSRITEDEYKEKKLYNLMEFRD
jgi:hypothetical protein